MDGTGKRTGKAKALGGQPWNRAVLLRSWAAEALWHWAAERTTSAGKTLTSGGFPRKVAPGKDRAENLPFQEQKLARGSQAGG